MNHTGQWQVATNPCVNNALQALNFPHPSDASKFLQCGLYERMYVVQCPTGELYDQATSSCISPKGTKSYGLYKYNVYKFAHYEPACFLYIAIVAQPTYIASLGIPSPCTAQSLQAGRIFFSVANSNNKFIQCDAAGIARVITCPDQLIWDQNRQSCVYTLQGGVANPGYLLAVTEQNDCVFAGFLNGANPCTAQAISAQALFFSHPDPTKFIQCDLQGNAFVQRCPSGLVWNQYLETMSQIYTITIHEPHRPVAGGDQPLRKQRSAGPEFPPPERRIKVSPMRTVRTNAIVAQPTYIASLGIPSPCTAQSLQAGRIFFSVANSNKQFIQCDAAGNARVITCPDQLIWDQNRQSCVYTLQGGVANPGYLAAVTVKLKKKIIRLCQFVLKNENDCVFAGFLNGANPCTAQAISAQALFFSHPDPTKFIQCDLQGNAFVQRCPSGLVWNQYLETCASQLASITLTGQTNFSGWMRSQWQVATNPCVNNALQALNFPHPSDASKFLQCGLYERMYVVQCPTGELYDQATSSCISPKAIVAQPTYIASLGIPSPCTAQSLQAGRIFFSVANSNKQFIQCDAAGIARVITCPDQLIWDQNRQSCVYTLQGGVANPGYLLAVTGSF
ncbi:hypothetical protein MAR_010668 [Mya arenaria]|uniref:Chitin-binding type-2 domain-containing protein n=1 Tax=Mya arenaria TaxID=6604 RepID=A0ABY7FVP0_MYAAR|nr:hypothetical protein MAR_010668 [Mya arenaria]